MEGRKTIQSKKIKERKNFSCIVHIRLLQFSSHGHSQLSQLCNSTDAEVQTTAARLILRASRHQNCTPLLKQLHWLPISERIKCKTVCMCYNTITDSTPSDLSELLHLYSPSRSLRSSSDTHAETPKLQPQDSWLSLILTLRPPHLEQSPPRHQALCYSLFLQKQTQDISLLRIVQLSNIVLHPYQSVHCVCVCASFT